jgi:hypothetical protein
MYVAQPQSDHIRAALGDYRAAVDRLVADHRARTRELAGRLHVPPEEVEPGPDDHPYDEDNDLVDSWMADPRASAPERRAEGGAAHDAVVGRLERGELTWGDLMRGRATDRDATVVREFLAQRITEARHRVDGSA